MTSYVLVYYCIFAALHASVQCEECVEMRNGKSMHQAVFSRKEGASPHIFQELTRPDDANSSEDTNELIDPGIPPMLSPSVHSGVACDFCGSTIVGTRHKCLDCEGTLLSCRTWVNEIELTPM